MMLYASQGMRNAARKGSNVLIYHTGPAGGTSANSTSRSLHIASNVWAAARTVHPPSTPILESNLSHKLFSASRNFLHKFFTHLTTPGLRAPTYLSDLQHAGTRSLHNAALRGTTIQSGLSLPARHALRNNALQRQASSFLPRGPAPPPPRCGGVTQVGLGTARNFSTGRPIFQQLAENVPVAGRALYEIDWDLEMRKEHERMRSMARGGVKKVQKSKEMMKSVQKSKKQQESVSITKEDVDIKETPSLKEEIEHYFSAAAKAPVITYLLIPLAPTPTARVPLHLNSAPPPVPGVSEPAFLPPLSYLGTFHASHSMHALRVSTLFTRLDQANVWASGVHCSAYSEGQQYQNRGAKDGEPDSIGEGVCTVLKVEFRGWTKAEVRGVIGESGSGWCVLEEVIPEEESSEEDGLSDMESLSSGAFDDQNVFAPTGHVFGGTDPAQSLVLPTLDFSSSFLASPSSSLSRISSAENIFASIPSQMETDHWVDEYPYSPSPGSSSYSDLSDLVVDPPSTNGWYGLSHRFGLGFSSQVERAMETTEPREGMFY